MKCLYTNADSLQNKLTELHTYIDTESIDIVAITESLCKNPSSDYDPVFVIDGFDCVQNNSGRGTLLFLRKNIEYTRLTECEDIFHASIVCKIRVEKSEFVLGVIYRSPNSTDNETQKVNDLVSHVSEKFNRLKVVIVGDFNFREIDWKEDICDKNEKHLASMFLDCVQENYLSQLIMEPTHHRGNQEPSLVDLIITNTQTDTFIQNIVHHPPLGKSHHSTIIFNLNIETAESENEV